MSLILDALRKSEAERQRGKAPGLFASTPGIEREIFPRMKLWPVLVFLALLLASAWVIWRGESRRAQGEQAATAGAPSTDAGIEVPAAAAGIDDAIADSTRPIQRTPSDASSSPTTMTTDPARAQAMPLPTSPTSPALIASQPAPATIFPASPASPTPLPPAPDEVAQTPAAESLPTVAILDSGTRASLPPLKLSMHVFGQDPAKRFAIIDGKRVAAGSLLGNGVVEEISRDGVVINVNGQRLLVPKP